MALFSLVIWYTVVLRSDGGNWLGAKFDAVKAVFFPGLTCSLAAATLGLGIGSAVAAPRVKAIWQAVVLGAITFALVDLWTNAALQPWASVPDWLSIGLLLTIGSAFSLGYGAIRRQQGRPLWPVAFPFIAFAFVASAVSGNIGSVVGAITLAVVGISVGRLVIGIRPAPVHWTLAGATGISVLILLFRVTGSLGAASAPAVIITLVAVAFVSIAQVVPLLLRAGNYLIQPRRMSRLEWLIVGVALSIALSFWLSVLAPETGPDALGGRSAIPIIWERLGSISGIHEIRLSYMGIGGEILNLIILPLTGGNVSKVTSFVCGLFLAGCIVNRSCASNKVPGSLAAILFFGSTVVCWAYIHGFVDVPMVFLTIASLEIYELWELHDRSNLLFVSGLVGGTAIAIKLNAGLIIPVIALFLSYSHWRRRAPPGELFRNLGLLATGVLITLAPALLRSYFLTGNPVFPFANSFFKSPLAETKLYASLYGAGIGWRTALLPYLTVLYPARYCELGTYHPAFWIVTLLAVACIDWHCSSSRRIWIAAVVLWIGWLLTEQNIRYSMPAMACTASAVASSFAGRRTLPVWAASALIFVAVMGIFVNMARPTAWMWSNVGGPAVPRDYLAGTQSADNYLATQSPVSKLGEIANRSSGTSGVIWMIPYLRDHQYFQGRVISHPHGDARILEKLSALLPDQPNGKDLDDVYQGVVSNGINYIIFDVNGPWTSGIPENQWPGLFSEQFSKQHLELMGADRNVRLYRITAKRPADSLLSLSKYRGGPIRVISDKLLGVRLSWDSKIRDNSYIDTVYLDKDGKMVFFDRIYLGFKATAGRLWHWQTIPCPAVQLMIYPSLGTEAVEIETSESDAP